MPVRPEATHPDPPQLSPAEQRHRGRKRRQREMLIAALAFVVVLILTSLQLNLFRSGDRLFAAVFQVNFVLLVGILLIVLRNAFKLLLERRRRVLGSRLRTRLVLAFVGLSLLPCLLMFLVTTKYVQLSMDFWFKNQIETSMEVALDLSRSVYEKTGSQLIFQAQHMLDAAGKTKNFWQSPKMNTILREKQKEYRLPLAGVYTADAQELFWYTDPAVQAAWRGALKEINWEQTKQQGKTYFLTHGLISDYVVALVAVDASADTFLVLAESMGVGFKSRFDRVVRGSGEYKHLRNAKKALKLMLYSSLGVLTTLIILAAAWFGFRLARELAAPIFALAAGTDRIAKGDLSVRLTDSSQDELGMLIKSFNTMAQDIEQSQRESSEANAQLEDQNKKIARHSKYIETVLNNIAAGVVSFDHNGYISTVNGAACEILEQQPEALIGKQIEDVLPAQQANIAKIIRNRFSQRIESRAQHTMNIPIGGEDRRLLVNVVGFSTEGVYRGAVAVFEDISELERMQRTAAWREVARRIAHEIKNPLTPIKLSAQRIDKKFGSVVNDPAFSQSTQLIVQQVEYLQEMVQEFSAFAKLPDVKPHMGRLEPLLHAMTTLFRNSHTSIQWELVIPEELPELPMDKEALHRAFMNIYTNASEILLQTATPQPFVRITAKVYTHLNLIRVDVADNGPGLTDEERSRLFEPYFSRKKGGTGLGLTIVRSIVSDHRGYVRALPRDGGGTIMTMELPLS